MLRILSDACTSAKFRVLLLQKLVTSPLRNAFFSLLESAVLRKIGNVCLVVSALLLLGLPASAQEKPKAAQEKTVAIRAGHLIDARSDRVLDNVTIIIKGDTIVSVTPGGAT